MVIAFDLAAACLIRCVPVSCSVLLVFLFLHACSSPVIPETVDSTVRL